MVKFKNSIATHLFRVIFGLYLLVTIIVTIVQMVFEYENVSENIKNEVAQLPATFINGLGSALWTYNERAIRSILIGMYEIPVVSGIKIDDGTDVRAIGQVASEKGGYIQFDESGEKKVEASAVLFEKLISYKFDISFTKKDGDSVNLGTGIIYTNNEIIFERVKYGFILIIINSVVKTTALFVIFLFFMRRILSRPLIQLANQTGEINLDNLKNINIDINKSKRNELMILEESFNGMIAKLLKARNELDSINLHLEEKVRARTEELENEVETRKHAQKQAEEANEIKSNFIANISHEIRTPMTSIYGMARFIQNSELEDAQKNYADTIVRNCENLMSLIEEILDFSKIESSTVELDFSTLNLQEFIEDTVNMFVLQASKKNINISFTIHSDVPDEILTDKNRLRQILINLINNALKFTETGNITIAIKPDNDDPGLLEFAVSDTGIGIPLDRQNKIFESFTQVDASTSRKYGGTGLGLSICKHFVEMLGGDIRVSSSPGMGSTFYFTIHNNQIDA